MALRYKDTALGETYKSKLIDAFPESDYAVAIADPDYEYHMRMMDRVQDSLYEATYHRYLEEDTATVRRNSREFTGTYPLSVLVPKFMFLKALTFVQAGDSEGFKAALTELVEKYPRADVTELAGEMLKGVLRGRTLMQGSMSRMTWNLRFGLDADGMLSAADSARQFVDEPDVPHRMLFVYKTGSIDRNRLLYAVAAFNFANFTVNVFDMNIETVGTLSIMTLTGFHSLDETLAYIAMIYGPDGYAPLLGQEVSFFPFSDGNYETLLRGKTLEEYMVFFAEHYAAKAPELIARWKIQMEEEGKLAEMEDREVEKAAGLADEEEAAVSEREIPVSEEEKPEKKVTEPEEQEKKQPVEEETPPLLAPEEKQETPPAEENVEEESPAPKEPAEITLEQLLERRRQADLEAQQRKEEEAKASRQKKKEADELKKQKAREREQARKQKQKETKERMKQKEKDRKEKERANKKRRKKR